MADATAAPVADTAATVGEPPAEATEGAEPEAAPVGATAPSGPDTSPAARFIRSLTSWGSGDHGSHDEPR